LCTPRGLLPESYDDDRHMKSAVGDDRDFVYVGVLV
jgi:hypothetical protein